MSDSLRERYEALAGGHGSTANLCVHELIARYMRDAEQRYDPRVGESSSELTCLREATRPVLLMYGDSQAESFGGTQLRATQLWLIDQGYCVPTIRHRIARVRRIFKWGVQRGYVTAGLLTELQCVESVRIGQAPPAPVIRTLSYEEFNATLLYINAIIGTALRVALYSGMRPGELVSMHFRDIDTSNDRFWVYRPAKHKTQWRGHDRRIYLGPKASSLVAPYLCPSHHLWLNSRGKPMTVNGLGQMVRRATKKAGIPSWGPQAIRRLAARRIRAMLSLDHAQVVLGHKDRSTTEQHYASLTDSLAIEAARRFG